SSSATRSTAIWKKWSTASTTWLTRSTASSSITCDRRGTATMQTATLALPLLVGLIALALAFDFLNGFHDAANSVATIVSTRVLSPRQAVVWAAFFNFVAFLVFQLNVASTVGKGIIDPAIVDRKVIAATLIAACI